METTERETGSSSGSEQFGDDDRPTVTASRSSPGRVVFTEDGNTDGWIATDAAVEPER